MRGEEIDIDIINRCIKNDRKAQELLYKHFFGPLSAVCMRYMGNEQEAMEVLNDGYLKIFKNLQQYDSLKSNLQTWMRRIMVNTAIDAIRKNQNLKFIVAQELENNSEPFTDDITNEYRVKDLLLLINQLPQTTKIVFNLYIIEGYSHNEISKLLTITNLASRWHLSEARKRLRELIKQNGE